MGMKQLSVCLLAVLLSSCAVLNKNTDLVLTRDTQPANILDLQSVKLAELPPAKKKPVIAVYRDSFQDLTGQRKSNSSFALFSTAVTQAPEALLIRALKHAANGNFFRVVERVGLDNLTKERQLIRSTRENFEEDQKLQPLLFAGLIIQGGVISYDTNIQSGGIGARYLGIGNLQFQKIFYRQVFLRTSFVLSSKARNL
jgi:curli production assembly/transport component CsgG